jgi:hypothetical protein
MVWKHFTEGEMKLLDKCCSGDLATSLDAWAEHIWPVMDRVAMKKHDNLLWRVSTNYGMVYPWKAEPLHHLEAALKAAGLWDEWKEGCE